MGFGRTFCCGCLNPTRLISIYIYIYMCLRVSNRFVHKASTKKLSWNVLLSGHQLVTRYGCSFFQRSRSIDSIVDQCVHLFRVRGFQGMD